MGIFSTVESQYKPSQPSAPGPVSGGGIFSAVESGHPSTYLDSYNANTDRERKKREAQKALEESIKRAKDTLNNPLIQGAAKVQDFILHPPTLDVAKNLDKSPVPAIAGAAHLVENTINTPLQSLQAGGQIGEDISRGTTTPTRLIKHVAKAAELPITIASFGAGGAALNAGEAGLKTAIKEGVKQGIKYGGALGLTGGLQNDTKGLKDQLISGAEGAAGGAASGAVAGAVLPVVGKAVGSAIGSVRSRLNLGADEALKSVKEEMKALPPPKEETKLLPSPQKGTSNTSERIVKGTPGTPSFTTMSDDVYKARFDAIKENYHKDLLDARNQSTDALHQRIQAQDIEDRYAAALNELDNSVKGKGKRKTNVNRQYESKLSELTAAYDKEIGQAQKMGVQPNGDPVLAVKRKYQDAFNALEKEKSSPIPNPDYQAPTPDRVEQTGFITGDAIKQESIQQSQQRKLSTRIGQIDKQIQSASETGGVDAGAMRSLMRERAAAKSVLDGKNSYDAVYGSHGSFGTDATTATGTLPNEVNKSYGYDVPTSLMGESKTVYRGTTKAGEPLNLGKANGITGGESTSTDPATAQRFADSKGGEVQQYTISPDAKVINHSTLEDIVKDVPMKDKAAKTQEFLQKNNIDVVKFDVPGGKQGESEYRIVSPNALEESPSAAAATGSTSRIKRALNTVFSPVSNLSQAGQNIFEKSAAGRGLGEVQRSATINTLKETAKEAGTKLNFDLAHQIESGTAPDNAFTRQFRTMADQVRQDAVDNGLDIGYRENYVPHIWEQSADKVDQIARGAGMKPRAGYDRVVPTYEEGLKLGLKPKYKDPAQMMGDYVQNIQNARTNVSLIQDLRAQGMISAGKAPKDWVPITAQGFPKDYRGAPMKAPADVATVINNIYGKSDSLVDHLVGKMAKLNSTWQDISLAGGIPKTPANFFTFSQMIKEISTGVGQFVTGQPIQGAKTIYNPVAAFTRSFSPAATRRFQLANQNFIEALAKEGVPLKFGAGGESRWGQLFNDPTFNRFMPDLQLGTAKNVFNNLSGKMDRPAAMKATADIMKKMYGITDQMATGRSKAVQDLISTVAFAPKYRESIINVLTNTLKSLDPRTYKDISYSLNRRLLAGLGVTYVIYDQLNLQATGHGMNDNPEGKEMNLAIPYGETDANGVRKVVYIPFMPSFLTLPRAAVQAGQAALKGDLPGVGAAASAGLSMPIQTGAQLLTNQDYFGRPIVIDAKTSQATKQEQDSPVEAAKKQAIYLAGQTLPGLPRAGLQYAQGQLKQQKDIANGKPNARTNYPAEQAVATALEAPLRFGNMDTTVSTGSKTYAPGEVTNDFYKVYNPAAAHYQTVSKQVTKLIKQGDLNKATRIAQEYNDTVDGKFKPVFDKFAANEQYTKDWTDQVKHLKISISERGFNARAKQ